MIIRKSIFFAKSKFVLPTVFSKRFNKGNLLSRENHQTIHKERCIFLLASRFCLAVHNIVLWGYLQKNDYSLIYINIQITIFNYPIGDLFINFIVMYLIIKNLRNNGSLYRMTLKFYNQQILKKMRLMKIACKVTIHTKVLLTCQNKTFHVYLWLTWYLMISQNYTAQISKVCFRKIPISEIC